MAFYDDFDYDLLNKDTNQIGGAYKQQKMNEGNDSMISFDNLKIKENNENQEKQAQKIFLKPDKSELGNANLLLTQIMVKNFEKEEKDQKYVKYKKKQEDKITNEGEYNYIEQNNINLLLSDTIPKCCHDEKDNFEGDKQVIQSIDVTDNLNKLFKGEKLDKLKSVDSTYKEKDGKITIVAKVYCVREKNQNPAAKIIGFTGSETKLFKSIKD